MVIICEINIKRFLSSSLKKYLMMKSGQSMNKFIGILLGKWLVRIKKWTWKRIYDDFLMGFLKETVFKNNVFGRCLAEDRGFWSEFEMEYFQFRWFRNMLVSLLFITFLILFLFVWFFEWILFKNSLFNLFLFCLISECFCIKIYWFLI